MAKNLKLNIKNAQLAEALKISKVIPKSRTKVKEETSTASEETEVKKAAVHKEVEPVIPPSTPKEKESVSFLEEARHYKAQANAAKFEPKATLPKESTVFGKNTDETETPSFQKNDKDLDDEKVKPSSTFKPRESNYTPREGTGQSYTPREGGFRPREAGSYTPREGGYKPREAGSYTPREGGYKPREAGSYTPREGGYKPREAGSYTPREGGFKPREPGSYTPREGGFKPREAGSYTPREGGFKPREAGSYTPREGGFRPREAGSFTPREGGFKPREAGAYTPREGGFRPAPGFQRPTSPSPLITPRAPGSNFTSGFRPVPATLPPSEKKTPSRVLDQEMGTKTKKVFSKDQKDSATKKRMDDKRSFNNQDRLGLRNDDQDSWRKKRTFKQKSSSQDESEIIRPKKLDVRVPITVKDLASMMKLKASQLIAKLFMQGVMITLNDFLEDETTIQLLGTEFDCDITIDTKEEDRIKITDKTIKQEIVDSLPENLILRAPVVAFMGHVDHGKTSLVDAIRKSNIAAGESGAITQHIGAFQCTTNHGLLTILDTPGHEAFNEMRARGADITDIVVLVIAGDEGIKPQTLEALSQARAAECPVVVAITKSDKPNFNLDNVYRQLADQDLLPEAWGGTTITVPCSSVNKTGISELLEMLALQSEILELKADPTMRARGTVIESEMHKGLGAVTTLLIQNGTLKIGDSVVIGEHFAKIKTMMNDHGQQVDSAAPSSPVKITGLSGLPSAGSEFVVVKNEKEAKELSEKRALGTRQLAMQTKRGSIESMLANSSEGVKKILPVILKADVQGSLEALKTSLTKIVTNKVELMFISASVGEISESDVALANASKAAIIGFHTDIESHAEPLIKEKHVKVIMQDVIYHVVDEVKLLMKAQLDKIAKEEISGKALIKAVFKASALGTIAGCQVTEGSIKRNNQVRVYRENEVIWKGHISSLKRVKDDVREATKGQECGIVLQGYNEFKDGDIIEGFDIIYLEQEL